MTALLLCSRSFFLSSRDLLVFNNSPATPSSVCLRPHLKHTYDTLWHHPGAHLKPPNPRSQAAFPIETVTILSSFVVPWRALECYCLRPGETRHSQTLKHVIALVTSGIFCFHGDAIAHVMWMLMCVNVLLLIDNKRFTWHHISVVRQTHGPSHEQEATHATAIWTQRGHLITSPIAPVRTIPLSSLSEFFDEVFNWSYDSLFLHMFFWYFCFFLLL